MSRDALEAEIRARLAAAERLLASGAMVGDTDDLHLWRGSRDLWAAATTRSLTAGTVHENVIHTFQRAVTPPPGEGIIAEDLPVELEAVRHAMAILIGVRAQLQRDVPEPPPENDRRGRRLGP
jgi:hypothetical protein